MYLFGLFAQIGLFLYKLLEKTEFDNLIRQEDPLNNRKQTLKCIKKT